MSKLDYQILVITRLLIFAVGLFGTAACEKPVPPEYEVLTEKYWKQKALPASDLGGKVGIPTPELMLHIRSQNLKEGRPEPKSGDITIEDLESVRTALKKLPQKLQAALNGKLTSIALVSNLGSSGYSNYIYSNDGYPERGFIVLDKSLISQSANEWITTRERSPFRCKEMTASFSRDRRDREAGLQYIVLHEFAHVFSEGTDVNPYIHDIPDQKELDQRSYGPMSWRVADARYVTKFDTPFLANSRIRYYAKTPSGLSCEDALRAYSELERTSFAALYAAPDPFEDFAESFANFVHVVKMGRPFEVVIRNRGRAKRYSSCWKEPRCAEKLKYFEKLYEDLK
jgi:hypothetical protein